MVYEYESEELNNISLPFTVQDLPSGGVVGISDQVILHNYQSHCTTGGRGTFGGRRAAFYFYRKEKDPVLQLHHIYEYQVTPNQNLTKLSLLSSFILLTASPFHLDQKYRQFFVVFLPKSFRCLVFLFSCRRLCYHFESLWIFLAT